MMCKKSQKSKFFAKISKKINNKKLFFAKRKIKKQLRTIAKNANKKKVKWFSNKSLAWKERRSTKKLS